MNVTNTTGSSVPTVSDTELIIETVVCVFIILCVLFGNGLVCIAFATDRKLQTTTNCFVVSLACSDLIVGTIVIPTYLYARLARVQYLSTTNRVQLALEIIGCSSSILSLVAISIERCISVTLPAIHRNIPRTWVYGAIAFVWLYAIFASGALMDVYTGKRRDVWIQIYKATMTFFLPLIVIIISYSIIFKVAILRTRRHNNQLSREIRIAVTISVVIGAFVCCWLPFFTIYLFAVLNDVQKIKSVDWRLALTIIKFLEYSNSIVNPIIYTYVNQDFRRSFLRLLSCFKNPRRRFESTLVSDRSRAGSQLESRTETTTLRTTPL